MEGGLVLRCEVSLTEAVQILCRSDSNDGYAAHFSTYPQSFPQVAIVSEVGQENGYSSSGQDIPYYPIQGSLSEVRGE